MIIKIDDCRLPALEMPDDFTTFKAVIHGDGLNQSVLDGLVEIGRLDEDKIHLWVHLLWLQAHGPQNARWRRGLDEMIAFASGRGWVDGAGAIRAHIQYAPPL
jgi:hypothetical protein